MDRHYAHYDTLARAIFVRATWIERYILHIFRISLLHAELIITSVESWNELRRHCINIQIAFEKFPQLWH